MTRSKLTRTSETQLVTGDIRLSREKGIFFLVVIGLLLSSFLVTLPSRKPAGDAYNYIRIAEMLKHFSYPSEEKRLPFFPFMQLFKPLSVDPILWSKIVSIVAYTLTILFLYLAGRQAGFDKNTMYLASFLYLINPSSVLNSIRPLADTFFVLWIMISLHLFYRAITPGRSLLFGTVLGLLCLTRFEGILFAGAFGIAYFLRKGVKRSIIVAVPLFLLLLLVPIKNDLVFGSPLETGYLSEESIAYNGVGIWSGEGILINMRQYKSTVGAPWKTDSFKTDILLFGLDKTVSSAVDFLAGLPMVLVFIGFVALIICFFRKQRKAFPILLAFILYNFFYFFWNPNNARYLLPMIPFLALFFSFAIVITYRTLCSGIRKIKVLDLFRFNYLVIVFILVFLVVVTGSSAFAIVNKMVFYRESFSDTCTHETLLGRVLPLLRQDGREHWDGTYLDFTVDEMVEATQLEFDVICYKGSGKGTLFDWYVGEDTGVFSASNLTLIRSDYVPLWQNGRQVIPFNFTLTLVPERKYTLYINSTNQDGAVSENTLYIAAEPANEITYGLRQFGEINKHGKNISEFIMVDALFGEFTFS